MKIQLHQIVKQYGNVPVVDHVDFSMDSGECMALLGPNGAGKTTIVKMICGLIQPTSGDILIEDYRIGRHRAVMQHIGVVLEGARNIYWRLSTWENLRYFASIKGLGFTSCVKERASQFLTDLGLWDRRNDEVRTFSRGMQQKVALACALVSDPSVLLLDEPTLGLDASAYHSIVEFLQTLRTANKTILLTSHDFSLIQEVAQRVIVMKQRVIFDGSVDELARLHGGTYTVRVLGHHPDLTNTLPDWTVYIDGAETVLTGNSNVYSILARLAAAGCEFKSANKSALTAEVFLRLLGETE